jgi:C-terminal processing protease CtpA/Prc
VIVLVDERSASSTELFAAMLQDSKAAVVIGAPTFGAGCGWTMGKYESSKRLEHSRARLLMPDCSRLRADGGDELDGIQPDLLIGIRRPDTQKQRADRVAARLPEALKLVSGGHSGT